MCCDGTQMLRTVGKGEMSLCTKKRNCSLSLFLPAPMMPMPWMKDLLMNHVVKTFPITSGSKQRLDEGGA